MLNQALIAALFGAASILVELAPDQPMPMVYVDEPLLIEVQTDRDTRATTALTVQATHSGQAWRSAESEITLRADSPHWLVYDQLPAERGYYATVFQLQDGGRTEELRAFFSRIDRPYTGAPQAFSVELHENPRDTLRLMRHVGVPAARIALDSPVLEESLALARDLGVKIYVRVDGEDLDSLAERVQSLASRHCQNIARWEIAAHGERERLARLYEAARAANCVAPVFAVLRDVEEVRRLMQDGGHALVKGIVAEGVGLEYAALLQWQTEIQEGGYESLPLETSNLLDSVPASGRVDPGLVFSTFMQRAGGAEHVGLDGRLLCRETPGELFAYFNGLAPLMGDLRPFGVMVLSANVSVPVFRHGNDWCVVLWNPGAAERIQLPVGEVTGLRSTDAFNNAMPVPEVNDDGLLALDVDNRLVLLWGHGGDLPTRVSRNHAGHIARRIAENQAFRDYLPADLLDSIGAIGREPGGLDGRTQYFQLLRSFPEVEAQWHAGLLPRPIAVPAIAGLAALARHLCVLEEARGEVILEPMSDMLSRAREYQSLYLTGTVGAEQPYNRGDWLLEEVKLLITEAQELAEAGARIEASAVAALAEWRARALEHAAKAGPQSTLSVVGSVATATDSDW